MKLQDVFKPVAVEVIDGRYKGIKGRIIAKTETMYQVVADNAARVDFVKQGEYIMVDKADVRKNDG